MSRGLRIGFTLSLLANVLLLGLVLGGLRHRFRGRPDREQRVEAVLAQLPADAQARFRAGMERGRSEEGARREQMRAARERAMAILRADSFDADAYQREVDQILALRSQGPREMSATIKELAQELPREPRAALAELLNRPPPRP